MSHPPNDAVRAELRSALVLAHSGRRLDPTPLEAPVRAFARSYRDAGVSVAECLVAVKHLLRELTDRDAPIFTPHVVGWTVRGYYEGTSPRKHEDRGDPR